MEIAILMTFVWNVTLLFIEIQYRTSLSVQQMWLKKNGWHFKILFNASSWKKCLWIFKLKLNGLVPNILVSQLISPSGEQPEQRILAHKSEQWTAGTQILLLYKTRVYYNKFDSRKSWGVNCWYVKIPQCRYMEHGLEYIMFYVQKHIAPVAIWSNPPQVHDKPQGVLTFVKLAYWQLPQPMMTKFIVTRSFSVNALNFNFSPVFLSSKITF